MANANYYATAALSRPQFRALLVGCVSWHSPPRQGQCSISIVFAHVTTARPTVTLLLLTSLAVLHSHLTLPAPWSRPPLFSPADEVCMMTFGQVASWTVWQRHTAIPELQLSTFNFPNRPIVFSNSKFQIPKFPAANSQIQNKFQHSAACARSQLPIFFIFQ